MKSSRILIMLAVVLATIVLSQGVVAQNYWMRPATERSVSLDFFKASYNDIEGLDFFTSMVYLSALIPANEQLTFVFDFPMSNFSANEKFFYYIFGAGTELSTYNESLLGNPYVGVVASMPSASGAGTFVGRLGFRPPFASDEKYWASSFATVGMFDRFEAFMPDLWTFSGGFGYKYKTESDFTADVDFTGDLMIPTWDEGEAEIFIDYNLGLWYRPQMARLGFGFAGRMIVTASDLDFGERTVHQFGFFGGYDFGRFEPGFHFRVPLDEDLSEAVDFVYGINLTTTF